MTNNGSSLQFIVFVRGVREQCCGRARRLPPPRLSPASQATKVIASPLPLTPALSRREREQERGRGARTSRAKNEQQSVPVTNTLPPPYFFFNSRGPSLPTVLSEPKDPSTSSGRTESQTITPTVLSESKDDSLRANGAGVRNGDSPHFAEPKSGQSPSRTCCPHSSSTSCIHPSSRQRVLRTSRTTARRRGNDSSRTRRLVSCGLRIRLSFLR